MRLSELNLSSRFESFRPRFTAGNAAKQTTRTRRQLRFEALEDRQLLATSSANIAIIGGPNVVNGGFLPTTGADFAGFTFTSINPADVTAANLAQYDTVVLNVASVAMHETTATLTTQEKADLVSFVGSGKKLVIYDSEAPPQDYSWLPKDYEFTTNNPGAQGANGTLAITEENTLSSADPTNPKYIDANYLSTQTDAVGDANVFVSYSSHWCADMTAINTNRTFGPVHTYATYSTGGSTAQGLFIYNGLDVDYMGYESSANGLSKIWLQELQQSFNPVVGLPCATPVTGIRLDPPTATNQIGTTYTATATLADLLGNPSVGVPVTFTILSGPNMGVMGTVNPADGKTNSNGTISFTYVGTAVGTDTIEATFVNANQVTIHSAPVTAIWTQTGSPPVAADNTFFTHVNTTATVAAPGVLINASDPDPAHVPLLTATKVSDPSHGTLTLNPDGSFVYVPAAGFVGLDTFQYTASDPGETSNVATVTINVFSPLTIAMTPESDSGESNTDQITNINQPTFKGTAESGSVVTLIARQNGGTPMTLGQMTVGADGQWSIMSNTALADGNYMVSVAENHPSQPGREVETTVLMNPVIIDTVGPKVVGLTFEPHSGQFIVTLQDDRSGLSQTILVDPRNYGLIKLHTPPSYLPGVTGVTASAPSPNDPTASQTVLVQINNGRPLHRGYYVVQVLSGGLVDRAGNALDGEFNGTLPSGNNEVGGNFQALLVTHGGNVQAPQVVTPSIQSLVDRHEARMTLLQKRRAAALARQSRLRTLHSAQQHSTKMVVGQASVPNVTTFAASPTTLKKKR